MRKVLSFVLVLALVLSSFSMAFAADTTAAGLTDIAGNANEDAIQVAFDLSIVTGNPDGTFLPDKAVNRAEFAAMITRALAIPDSALAGYSTTSFKDTAGYAWAVPYLAFCQSKGILLGDGNGNVFPGKTINMNEAVTMALRAIGYTANSAELVGVWPSNYVTIGQNYGLYDDVAKKTDVNKAMAAQIIYNLLTVQKVVVNADGDTGWLWVDEDDEDPANLLNTNLGCTAHEDVILGTDGFGYADSVINITDKIGAFGTAYTNDDDDDKVVAFVTDSTKLTGTFNDAGDKFKVGDVSYSIDDDYDTYTTDGAWFLNTVAEDANDVITPGAIIAYAWDDDNTDDGETVTLNVDLSGKTIKDIYSVVSWDAGANHDLASSDVQEDIADSELLGCDFATTDDDEIDMNSFKLVGVASLDKIAEDDVVYVYTEETDDDYIRMVAVGTETVEGTVDEVDDGGSIVIADKEYDIAPATLAAVTIDDFDTDSEGTFYLDVNGEVYDFDGTGGADTYGVVKASTTETPFDNFKIKLYKSDDATKTFYLNEEDPADIDWTSESATTVDAIVTGALIGYSLDSNGDIDTIDNSQFTLLDDVDFQSTKVLKIDGDSYSIDSNAVVFTYLNTTTAAADYDLAKLNEVKDGAIASGVSPASIIVNDDGDVVAMFIDESFVEADNDDVYGVFNSRTSTKNTDGDEVYKFKGFIDGTAFTKLTDDRDGNYDDKAGVFGVYTVTVDANDVITDVTLLAAYNPAAATDESGRLTPLNDAPLITSISSDRTVVTSGSDKYTIDDDAVVYKYDAEDEEFTVSKLSALKKDYNVALYDCKGDDANGSASVVIYIED